MRRHLPILLTDGDVVLLVIGGRSSASAGRSRQLRRVDQGPCPRLWATRRVDTWWTLPNGTLQEMGLGASAETTVRGMRTWIHRKHLQHHSSQLDLLATFGNRGGWQDLLANCAHAATAPAFRGSFRTCADQDLLDGLWVRMLQCVVESLAEGHGRAFAPGLTERFFPQLSAALGESLVEPLLVAGG